METALRLLVILVTPSAVAGIVLVLPRLVRALGRRLRPAVSSAPAGPPLERTAADLRRLLAEHATVRRSEQVPLRARRLAALEGALTDCALDAARALDLPTPPRPGRAPLPREQLRQLLEELAAAGLVVPPPDSLRG